MCKLVGEISVHAPVRVPRFSPDCAHSRADARSRPEPSPTPTARITPHPPARPDAQSGTLGPMRAYFLVEGTHLDDSPL